MHSFPTRRSSELYRIPDKGLALGPDPNGYRFRQGFFLGDGTRAGKGRQLAGIVMDQWLRGNRRHLWLSDSSALIEDARRDWQALGGKPLDIQPLGRVRRSEEHTSELQSLMRTSYAAFCWKK